MSITNLDRHRWRVSNEFFIRPIFSAKLQFLVVQIRPLRPLLLSEISVHSGPPLVNVR